MSLDIGATFTINQLTQSGNHFSCLHSVDVWLNYTRGCWYWPALERIPDWMVDEIASARIQVRTTGGYRDVQTVEVSYENGVYTDHVNKVERDTVIHGRLGLAAVIRSSGDQFNPRLICAMDTAGLINHSGTSILDGTEFVKAYLAYRSQNVLGFESVVVPAVEGVTVNTDNLGTENHMTVVRDACAAVNATTTPSGGNLYDEYSSVCQTFHFDTLALEELVLYFKPGMMSRLPAGCRAFYGPIPA